MITNEQIILANYTRQVLISVIVGVVVAAIFVLAADRTWLKYHDWRARRLRRAARRDGVRRRVR